VVYGLAGAGAVFAMVFEVWGFCANNYEQVMWTDIRIATIKMRKTV
jgi:hypothetical protein